MRWLTSLLCLACISVFVKVAAVIHCRAMVAVLKQLKHTVAAVMRVNANQMEARILLRRTCDRVANLNRYLIRYLPSNHDVSALIDSAHTLRYATKYCAKSGKHTQLLDEMIEHLNKRSTDLLPPNMKHVLSNFLVADCSHRAFMSKQTRAVLQGDELARDHDIVCKCRCGRLLQACKFAGPIR